HDKAAMAECSGSGDLCPPPAPCRVRGLGCRAKRRLERILRDTDDPALRALYRDAHVWEIYRDGGCLRARAYCQTDACDAAFCPLAARSLADEKNAMAANLDGVQDFTVGKEASIDNDRSFERGDIFRAAEFRIRGFDGSHSVVRSIRHRGFLVHAIH